MNRALSIRIACEHCGSFFFSGVSSTRFCCGGCEFVYALIQEEGLGRYHELRAANPPECPVPAASSNANYDYCDDDEFIRAASSDGIHMSFFVEGLNCTACIWLLERLPSYCGAAAAARIDMSTSTIEVARRSDASFAKIARTLNRFGYRPHPLRERSEARALKIRERRSDLIRIGVAGAATGNIMILAISIYAGATGELATQFRWLSALLGLPVLTYGAWPFYRSCAAALRSRELNLDVPIVAAILAGAAMSAWSLVESADSVYFDSLSTLVFLLLSSRFILKNVQNAQLSATNLEDELLLGSVRRLLPNGEFENVSSLRLTIGDVIEVAHQSVVPIDGVVASGSGAIGCAVLTGESEPREIGPGSAVEAGSQSLSGAWTLRVEALPRQTKIARVLRDAERSAQEKSNVVQTSDKIARWFVAAVFLGAIALIACFSRSDTHEGISRALALLIVTCPCVFGMAIPLSMSLAIRGAARRGIVVKNANSIEALWRVKALALDKTGTLTTGEMSVLRTEVADGRDLSVALGLEADQKHPVGQAIAKSLREQGVEPAEISELAELPAGGVSGFADGAIHSLRPMDRDLDVEKSEFIRAAYGLFRGDALKATFELGDRPRDDAATLINWARDRQFRLRLISGDRKGAVVACANAIGLAPSELQFNASPEEKALAIRSLGPGVAMIGDGANDAVALAAADVGIAACGSLEVSLRAADVYLSRASLELIPELFEIARLTRSAIFRNLAFSASFNAASGYLAATGSMTPLWAAVLMPTSSFAVLLSALWTGRRISKPIGLK